MRGEQVIVIETVLNEQLPVGFDVVFLRPADHFHAAAG